MKQALTEGFFLWLLLCCGSSAIGQELGIEHFQQNLAGATTDSARIYALNELGHELAANAKYADAVEHLTRALKLAKVINCVDGEAQAEEWLADLNLEQGYYRESLPHSRRALALRISAGHKKDLIKPYSFIASAHSYMGEYPSALQNYLSVLKVAEEIKDEPAIASVYNNLGRVYFNLKDKDAAFSYCNKSLRLSQRLKLKSHECAAYNNLAGLHFANREFDKAYSGFEKALQISRELKQEQGIANMELNMGMVKAATKDYHEAIRLYESSLNVWIKAGNKRGELMTYNSIAAAYAELNKLKESKVYFQKALKLGKETNSRSDMRHTYECLAIVDSLLGDYRGALKNFRLFIAYRDSMHNEEVTKETVRAQMQFDFDKKEREAKLLLEKKEILAAEESRRKTLTILFTGGGLILTLLFSAFLFNRIQVIRKQKAIIESQKQLVEEKQKEIIDSIHYAERIQKAFLKNEQSISKSLHRTRG